jgi:hypothetical protein
MQANVAKWVAMSAEEKAQTHWVKVVCGEDVKQECACSGGGQDPKPPKGLLAESGNDTSNRVDNYGQMVVALLKARCAARNFFLGTGGCLCPR